MEIITQSAQDTQNLGQKIAASLIQKGAGKSAEVIALYGELGSGKTTFTQGLAKSLGVPHRLLSPTFTIVREHALKTATFKKLVHIDLYRVDDKDIGNLGFGEFLADPANIVVIEWAEKFKQLPANHIDIYFTHHKDNRLIKINGIDL